MIYLRPRADRLDFGIDPDVDLDLDQFLHFSSMERKAVLHIK